MQYRNYYLESLMPIWQISHDIAKATFEYNEAWLFEIREACELLADKTKKQEYSLHDKYATLLVVVSEIYKVAKKHNLLKAS